MSKFYRKDEMLGVAITLASVILGPIVVSIGLGFIAKVVHLSFMFGWNRL